jgi:hypothetical protein
MGEIADSMIRGETCNACGIFLEGEGYGVPRVCTNECARDVGGAGMQTDGAIIYEQKDFENSEFAAPDDLDISL